jgi:DNA-binding transcriptional MerR regulator
MTDMTIFETDAAEAAPPATRARPGRTPARTRHAPMTVGELSRHTGIPVKALRQYTDWGLVATLGRSSANYRLFTAEALWCLEQIRILRELGLTLADIRELAAAAGTRPLGPLLADFLDRARARLDAQIAAAQRTKRRIEQFADRHRPLLSGTAGDDLWSDGPRTGLTAA